MPRDRALVFYRRYKGLYSMGREILPFLPERGEKYPGGIYYVVSSIYKGRVGRREDREKIFEGEREARLY